MADLVLGIDAGGTFTDALIYCTETRSVLAHTKTPTTHDNLSLCLAEALETVLTNSKAARSEVSVVSVSTTLATNALVEDSGRPAGLITIGFKDDALNRAGLLRIGEHSPHLKLAGGHTSHGNAIQDLELAPIDDWLTEHDPWLEAYAVNAPRRATTALLNARLVPIINELVTAVEESMLASGVTGRLMVMRGDGSLVSSEFVRNRPIETILSGPAASELGAATLSGLDDG
ncbi:MAG: hydantoinase/oxoprolinase N-terminal domain-containing protein, partial [Acidimicrobiales bacterium]